MENWKEIGVKRYNRINVIGCSGSGKTTFSRQLSVLLGIPYVELDGVFWEPNWTTPEDEVFYPRLKKALEPDFWVLDGNYSRTVPIKWEKVQAVIWLDYSFARTIFRSVKRATTRAITKEELWPGTGNRESFRKGFFSKDSIILWAIKNHAKIRRRYEALDVNGAYQHIDFIRIASPQEAEAYLRALAGSVVKDSERTPTGSATHIENEEQIGAAADH